MTADLARDLANDIITLMSSTRPYIRKKAVLLMYKVFLRFPEALRPAFPRLKEKLEDPDPGRLRACTWRTCALPVKERYLLGWVYKLRQLYYAFIVRHSVFFCVHGLLIDRCSISCCECDLWAGEKESQELLVSGAALLQAHDELHQQLGAHQNHQPSLRSVILVKISGAQWNHNLICNSSL